MTLIKNTFGQIQNTARAWTRSSSSTPKSEAKPHIPKEPTDGFSGNLEPETPSITQRTLTAAKKAAITGAGLSLTGVPVPISATIAGVQLASELAPETTKNVLTNTAVATTAVAGGVVLVANSLTGPITALCNSTIEHGMGHDFLPGV